MSAVFKTKLYLRCIEPFAVVTKNDLSYTLILPRKLCTHPMFYFGSLSPYRKSFLVNLEGIAPTKVAMPRIAASASGHTAILPSEVSPSPGLVDGSRMTLGISHAFEDAAPRDTNRQSLLVIQHGIPPTCRSPPIPIDEQGRGYIHVAILLKAAYTERSEGIIGKKRGYPESENLWENDIRLRQDWPFAFDFLSAVRRVHSHNHMINTCRNRCRWIIFMS